MLPSTNKRSDLNPIPMTAKIISDGGNFTEDIEAAGLFSP
jgi:hypothetical protein